MSAFSIKMENGFCSLHLFLHRVHDVLLAVGVEAGPDHVLLVLGGGAEVHVHQAVVDPVVLRVVKVMVGVEVFASRVLLNTNQLPVLWQTNSRYETSGLCVWPFLLSQLYLRMVLFRVAGSLPYIVPADGNFVTLKLDFS